MNSSIASLAVAVEQKALDALTKSRLLGPLRVALPPYLWFSPVVIQFLLLWQRSDTLVSLKKQETSFEASHSCRDPMERTSPKESYHKKAMKQFFLSYIISESLTNVIFNSSLYILLDDWSVLARLRFHRGCLPVVSAMFSGSVPEALPILRLLLPQLQTTGYGNDAKVVMMPDWQPPLASLCKTWSLLFSAPWWAERKLERKQLEFQKKITM